MRYAPLALLLVSSPALACPVCGGGGPNQQAFVDTMIFLSLLPLTLMGGLVLFYRQKLREQQERSGGAQPRRSVDHPVG